MTISLEELAELDRLAKAQKWPLGVLVQAKDSPCGHMRQTYPIRCEMVPGKLMPCATPNCRDGIAGVALAVPVLPKRDWWKENETPPESSVVAEVIFKRGRLVDASWAWRDEP